MRAKLWESANGGSVRCGLCRHACLLTPGQRGLCGVRANEKGELCSLIAHSVAAVNLDPVEKKPLYHYRPGSKTFSLGAAGCNFSCRFCQNHELSRTPADTGRIVGKRTTPEILVREAEKRGAASLAFTYTEPTVFYELMYDTAGVASTHGLECVMVSNGFQSQECLSTLYRRIRAANIDLKSFREDFYRKQCRARLAPVLDNLKTMCGMGWWIEITTLLIPGLNDSDAELRDIARFIRDELGAHVPWHLSRFHGAYQMAASPPTPLAALERAWALGREEGLSFVYIGNVQSSVASATYCPACGETCVTRQGYTSRVLLKNGSCPQCGMAVPGIWGEA